MLDQAVVHLTPGGQLLFPVISLSRETEILERAARRFATVVLVEEQWYPANEQLLAHGPLLDELSRAGRIRLEQRGSRLCWATQIYRAQAR